MKKILVISGKGGTGKTFLTASLSYLASDKKIIVDCDVDAANLYLLLHPDIKRSEVFEWGYEAVINQDKCIRCGKCLAICRFEAIKTVHKDDNRGIDRITVDPFSCEGCGVCKYGCPVGAVDLRKKESGKWFISDTKYGPFVFAKLGIAAENSGKLVSKIKQEAYTLAEKELAEYIIIDGPPGIGCPVIASMSGVDLALVVTEPTLSGISDMKRVMEVAEHFQVETKVVVNKYDINLETTEEIRRICYAKGIEVLGQLPFSEKVVQSIVKQVPFTEFSNGSIAKDIAKIWEKIK
ncbi:MAG TPA: ATP-binding protein [bacterium]|nr:ATP-binding protein [bacterium]HOL49690.1 ATP-binding protein [bacterium]HPO51907.1 ATP-binding protein [bacterium]